MNVGRGTKPLRNTGRLKVDGVEVAGVRCDIDLPSRTAGVIEAKFEWRSNGRADLRPGFGTFEFDTKIDIGTGFGRSQFRLLDMHVSSVTKRVEGKEALDVSAIGSVGTLEKIHWLGDYQTGPVKTLLTLFLTPNRMLQPWRIAEYSFTGEVKYHRGKKSDTISLRVPGVGVVAFENYFEWDSDSASNTSQSTRFQCATVVTGIPATDSDAILRYVVGPLEDLLLLAGFASRTPTRCAGWLACDGIAAVDHYRRQVSLPPGKQRHRTITNGGLVELVNFRKFLVASIRTFDKSVFKTQIRQAIYALNNSPDDTIEHRVVSLFSAFEGLVDAIVSAGAKSTFAKDTKKRDSVRDALLAHLEEWVKTNELSEELCKQFAKQIRNISSISLSARYAILDKTIEFEHRDLWPIVATGKTKSLYVLRSRLAHGAPFEERHFEALVTAGQHLEWLVERLICAVLKWPLEKTDLSVAALPTYWGKEWLDWQRAEKAIRD